MFITPKRHRRELKRVLMDEYVDKLLEFRALGPNNKSLIIPASQIGESSEIQRTIGRLWKQFDIKIIDNNTLKISWNKKFIRQKTNKSKTTQGESILKFVLKKIGQEQNSILSKLEMKLDNQISRAGNKDKQGVTYQWMTIDNTHAKKP
eukprot:UN07758